MSFLDAIDVDASNGNKETKCEHDDYRRKDKRVVRQVARNPEAAICAWRMRSNLADVVEPIESEYRGEIQQIQNLRSVDVVEPIEAETAQGEQLSNAFQVKAQIELISSKDSKEDRQEVCSLLRLPRCGALWIGPNWIAIAEG